MADDEVLRVDLEKRGHDVISKHLSEYNFTRLIGLLEKANHEILETFAVLPRTLAHEVIESEYLWDTYIPQESVIGPLARFIREFLELNPEEHVCVIEAFLSSKDATFDDGWDWGSRVFYNESLLYHVSIPGDSCERIECSLREVPDLPYFALILTSHNGYFASHPDGKTDFNQLEELAQNARYFIATPWDGSGYLVARLGESSQLLV